MKKVLITLTAIFFSTATFAQSELAGSWTFQNQESISGKLYRNGSPKSINISVSAHGLTFEKVTAGNGQDYTSSEIVASDGKPFETTTSAKRKKVVTIKKEGGNYIENAVFYSAADTAKVDHRTTDTWSLLNGQLILDRKDENLINGEIWESKAVYTKSN